MFNIFHQFVVLLNILTFVVVGVRSIACKCNTTNARFQELETSGSSKLLVFHPDDTNIQFVCFREEKDDHILSTETYRIDLFNKTYKVSMFRSLNLTKDQFNVEWDNKIFHKQRDAFFAFQTWDLTVSTRADDFLHFQTKITLIPADIMDLFVSKGSQIDDDVDLLERSKEFESTCNEELKFLFDHDVSFLRLQFLNHTSNPVHMKFNHNDKSLNINGTQIVITSSHVIMSVNGSILIGSYDSKLKKIVFNKDKFFKSFLVDRVFYTPQCLLGNPSTKRFDVIVAVVEEKNITGRTHLAISHYPYRNWTKFLIKADPVEIVDIAFDHGRDNIILLVRRNNSLTKSRKSLKVYVLSEAGGLMFHPWDVVLEHFHAHLRLHMTENVLYLKNHMTNKLSWSSDTGGHTFKKEVSLDELTMENIHYQSSRTMEFVLRHKLNTTEMSLFAKDVVWTKLGVLFLYEIDQFQRFYFCDNLLITNNPIPLSTDILLTKINSTHFYIKQEKNNTLLWPPYWKDSVIFIPWYFLLCKLESFRSNGTEIVCSCISTEDEEFKSEYVIYKNTWMNVRHFSVNTFCTRAEILNSTFLQVNLTSNITNNTGNILLTWESNPLGNLQTGPYNIGILDRHRNHLISFTPITKIDVSEIGHKNVCFHYDEMSFERLLLQHGDQCPVTLNIHGINKTIIYLDISDEFDITIVLDINSSSRSVHYRVSQLNLIRVYLSHPKNLFVRTKYTRTRFSQQVFRILLKQRPADQIVTMLSISTLFYHKSCNNNSHVIKVLSDCPPGKQLVFEYPKSLTVDHLLIPGFKDSSGITRVFKLPINYQPPSSKGRGIPVTKNVYNADPSMEMYQTPFLKNHNMHEFKQCKGKMSRASCDCTHLMRISTKESESDCIEKVFRLLYREKITPRIFIMENKMRTVFSHPLLLKEINKREDFLLFDTIRFENESQALLMECNSSIELKGSGLYHFKVKPIITNISFCKLEAEFLVYVDGTPLPHPIDDVVSAATAFFFGFILLGLFLYQYYKPLVDDENEDDESFDD